MMTECMDVVATLPRPSLMLLLLLLLRLHPLGVWICSIWMYGGFKTVRRGLQMLRCPQDQTRIYCLHCGAAYAYMYALCIVYLERRDCPTPLFSLYAYIETDRQRETEC